MEGQSSDPGLDQAAGSSARPAEKSVEKIVWERDAEGRRRKKKKIVVCCNQRWELGSDFTRHKRIHTRPLPCEALEGCPFPGAPTEKDRNRHYRVHHRAWADRHNVPDESCECEACGRKFTRKDRKSRHLRINHRCRAEVARILGT